MEFALILPILVLLVTGIMQFGFLLAGQVSLVNGVREAARFGSVLPTKDGAEATANAGQVNTYLTAEVLPDYLPGFRAANLGSVAAEYCYYQNPNSSPPTYSVRLTVSASYGHPLFIPIISNLIDGIDGTSNGAFDLSAVERFRVENQPLAAAPPGIASC